MLHNREAGLLLMVIMLGNLGCVDSQTTEPPPSFSKLLNSLIEVDSEIQKKLSADPPGDAHDLVHDAGRIVSNLAEIDSQSGLNATQCTEVHNVAQDLLGAYGGLDAAIETGEAPDYESLRQRIQTGLVELQKVENDLP